MILNLLKSHLVTNPMTRLTWGIEPKNWKKLNRAFGHLFVPLFVYLLLGASFYLVYFETWHNSFTPAVVYGGLLSSFCLPAIGLFIHSPIEYRRANWDDFSLAGLSQAQITLGICSPHLLGVLIVICLHLLASLAAGVMNIGHAASDNALALSLVAGISTFGLGSASLLGVARIPFVSSRLLNASVIYGVGFLSSPALLLVPILILYNTDILSTNWLTKNVVAVALWSELVSWLPRGYIVWRAWRRLLNEG